VSPPNPAVDPASGVSYWRSDVYSSALEPAEPVDPRKAAVAAAIARVQAKKDRQSGGWGQGVRALG
ncbi:hypothetical protein NSR24_23345, partial [Salmonella enterica]|nr:hypothetical protein [Salmonella enterica]